MTALTYPFPTSHYGFHKTKTGFVIKSRKTKKVLSYAKLPQTAEAASEMSRHASLARREALHETADIINNLTKN